MSAAEQRQPYEVIGQVGDDDWKARRATGVGASEAAIMLGVHPWHGEGGPAELFAWKTGRSDRPDRSSMDELAHWGHVLEPVVIAQYATQRYANRRAWPSGDHLRSTEHPWALATLDGWTEHPVHGVIPLEVKTVNAFITEKWEDSTPIEYWWQVQHQLLVTGAPCGSIAALVGGHQLWWEDIPRDEMAIRRLSVKGDEFWRCVEEERVPVHVPTLLSVSALYPPGCETGRVQLTGDNWRRIDDRLGAIKDAQRQLKAERDALEAELKDAIGARAEAVLDDGVTFTLKTQRRSETVLPASEFRVLRRKAPRRR